MNSPQKVALVTGASSGVGEALAPLMAEAGYKVYGLSRRSVALPGVIALQADLSDADSLQAAIAHIIAATGRLDVVMHCAGIGGAGPVEQMPLAEAKRIMDTNFWGTFALAQACLPHLLAAPSGRLLVMGSIGGYMGIPFRSAYCASKGALLNLVESLRLEVSGSALQVSCICPGDMATNSIATQYRMPYPDVDERYRKRYQTADEGMANNVNHGMDARFVAKKMLTIAEQKKLDSQYIIGPFVQKISPLAKRFLPSNWWEKLLGSYYQ